MRSVSNRIPGLFRSPRLHRADGRGGLTMPERALLLAILVVVVMLATTGRAWATSQRSFGSPEHAVEALLQAVDAGDPAALLAVLGPAREWLFSGDRVADRQRARRFGELYRMKHSLVADGDRVTLTLGPDDYPFAFPLVQKGSQWTFDTQAGKETLLARRIGENELAAIQTLKAIVDAQREYASADRNGDGVVEYAQRFASTANKRDGLYWPAKAGEPPSPLGPLVVSAAGEGYRKAKDGPTPYHGYLFRMLKGEGKAGAPDAIDYVVRGRGIGGFAVVAYPAKYGNTGIMTFVVTHRGEVYEADLGPQTAAKGAQMQRAELRAPWKPVALN